MHVICTWTRWRSNWHECCSKTFWPQYSRGGFLRSKVSPRNKLKAFFVSYTACVFAVYPRWQKVAADKHVLKLPLFTLTRLTAVIFTKLRLKVKSIACVTSVSPRVRRESWDESKKKEGKEGNACPQTPRFWKNCVRPRTQLLIGAVLVVLIT